MIDLKAVTYNYETFSKEAGFWGSLKDFRKRKKETVNAVKGVDLKIERGEIIGLIGPNGAGKTTLIKIMTGILAPTEGNLTCAGFDPFQKQNDYLKNIGVVLGQKSQLIWDLPASETLEMLRVMYNIEEKTFRKNLTDMIILLNIENKLNTPVRKLSLGERIKFEIICSLIHEPDILFLDEPTIGLDITSQRNIHEFLLKINRETQTTIILTSHYMKDIETLCNRVVIILEGNKVSDTSIETLKQQIKIEDEYILEFKREIPDDMKNYIQINDTSIKIPNDSLTDVLDNIKDNDIQSLYSNRPNFETIIYDIFSKGEI